MTGLARADGGTQDHHSARHELRLPVQIGPPALASTDQSHSFQVCVHWYVDARTVTRWRPPRWRQVLSQKQIRLITVFRRMTRTVAR